MLAELPWTWLLIRGTGVAAWVALTAVVVWGLFLRTRLLGDAVKPLGLMEMHRWLGALALALLAGHIGVLLFDPAVSFNLFNALVPGASEWNRFAVALGQLALWVMIPVAVMARLRTKMGKSGAKVFTRTHKLAYAAWPLATAHYVLAGTDALAAWSLMLIGAGATVLVFTLLARGHVPAPERPKRAPVASHARTRTAPSASSSTVQEPVVASEPVEVDAKV